MAHLPRCLNVGLSTGTAVHPSVPYGDAFPEPSMARAEKQYVVPGVPVNRAFVAVVLACQLTKPSKAALYGAPR